MRTASRAVFDPNVLVSVLLSRAGAPAMLVSRWLTGDFELVTSDKLIGELERCLGYPKIRARVTTEHAAAFIELIRRSATFVPDPSVITRRSRDPDDDYLPALAEVAAAVLVTGDEDLLALSGLPIRSPRAFLDGLGPSQSSPASGD